MRTFLGVLAFLFSSLIAKFSFGPKKSWSIIYRGNFNKQSYLKPVIMFSGDMIKNEILCKAHTGLEHIAKGNPGDSLSPTSAIELVLQDGDAQFQCKVDVSKLIDKPLRGYIEIMADSQGVLARAMQYTWGGTLSFDTGQVHPSVKKLSEIKFDWGASPADPVSLYTKFMPS